MGSPLIKLHLQGAQDVAVTLQEFFLPPDLGLYQ